MISTKNVDKLYKDLHSDMFTTHHAPGGAQLSPIASMITALRDEIACYPIGERNFNKIRNNPLHYHDFIEIFWMHSFSSKMDITIANRDFELKGGRMTIIPMALPHCLNAAAEGSTGQRPNFTLEALRRHVGEDALALFFDWAYLRPWVHGGNLNRLTLKIPEESQFYFNRLTNELEAASRRAASEQLKRGSEVMDEYNAQLADVLREFSSRLYPIFYASCSERELKAFEKYRPPMLAVLNYIEEHLTEQIKLSDLCKITGWATTRFSIVFREIMKLSPTEYINFVRMRKARYLIINTDMKLSEVGEMCGFNSTIYFDRVFKSHTGCTPKVYRNEYILEWQ